MSSSIVFNGNTYVVPATGEVGWGNNVSNYLIAIAAGCLQKTGGSFTLTAETDFGATYGLKSAYFKSKTTNAASAGQLRLAAADSIAFRNNANNGDNSLAVDSSDRLTWNGIPIVEDLFQVPIVLPNSSVTGATATATTGGSLADGTYYYKIYPVFGSYIGSPSVEKTVVIGGGNSATQLNWTLVTGATAYRVSRGTVQGAQDGYYTVSTNSKLDTGAAFSGAGNAFTQANAQWLTIGGNIVMPASSGGMYFQSYLDGSIVANVSLTSADEMQYITGTSGVHAFIDVNNIGILEINRSSTHTELAAFNTSWALGDLDITYGTSLNIRPGNVTKWTFNSTSLVGPAGTAANPSIDLVDHTGIYQQATGVLGITLAGTNQYNFLSTDFRPAGNNTQDLGSDSARWRNVKVGTQLINTATSNQLLLGITNTTTISATAPAASRVYTIPDAGGAANFLLSGWGQIVNADINASAAIAYSKLALTGSIVNADINASAAIAYSKAALTGSIVNADINASAAIAYSKLALTGSIVDADINASAAIAYSKLASLTSAHILVGSAGNVATDVAVTGEIAITNAGVTSLATTIANAHTFTGSITMSSTSGNAIHANTASATAVSAGNVGQVIENTVGATNFPTSGQYGDLTSIALTPGNWLINLFSDYTANGATVTSTLYGITPNAGNDSTGLVAGVNFGAFTNPSAASDNSAAIPSYFVVVTTNTTYYLKYRASYTVATPQALGRLTAVCIG